MSEPSFTTNGYQVFKPDAATDPFIDGRGMNPEDDWERFEGRIPFVHRVDRRAIYTGLPGWFHNDVYEHHNFRDSYSRHGYFGGGPEWGHGRLKWYGTPPEDAHDVESALKESGYEISSDQPVQPEPAPAVDEADLWDD